MQEVPLLGMRIACLSAAELVDHVFGALAHGTGGWIVTANLDFLRRHHRDSEVRGLYDAADVRVADGMPLVWAARWQRTPLPERVAGASLVPLMAQAAVRHERSIYLLGGAPGAGERAVAVLEQLAPGLRVVGHASPQISDPPSQEDLRCVAELFRGEQPDLLFVGLGSPKQERVCAALRARFPSMWMMGVGYTFSFLAGETERAPGWMQRAGLEWLHRLSTDPRRLARRYLIEDLPFAAVLFAHATARRLGRSGGLLGRP